MAIKPDPVSILLAVALAASFIAFFTGAFPYPYGWAILSALLVFRWSATRNSE